MGIVLRVSIGVTSALLNNNYRAFIIASVSLRPNSVRSQKLWVICLNLCRLARESLDAYLM